MFDHIQRVSVQPEGYHALEAYSSSDIRTVLSSGLNPLKVREREPKEPDEAMILGSAFDCLLLEPQHFSARYTVLPVGAQVPTTPLQHKFVAGLMAGLDITASHAAAYATTSPAKASALYGELEAYIVALRAAQTPLTQEMKDRMEIMRDALLAHDLAMEIMAGEKQVAYTSTYEGVPFKALPDIVGAYTTDLKTTGDFDSIRWNFFKRGYDVQLCHYREFTKRNGCVNIFVESVAPHRVKIVDVTAYVNEAEPKYWDAVERLVYAHQNGAWTHAREYYEGGFELL